MAKKATAKADEQSKRFIAKARELGCDEDPKAFERTFGKIVAPKQPKKPSDESKKTT